MQKQSYRARTGGYRPASGGSQPRSAPRSGAPRPRTGAQGQGRPTYGGSTRTGTGSSRPGTQRPTGSGTRRPPQQGGPQRPYRQSGAPRPPQQGGPRRPVQNGGARRPFPPPSGKRRPPQQPGRRPSSHRAPRRRPQFSLFAFVALAVAVIVAVYVFRLYSIVGFGEPKFIKNVYVNEVSYAGMTKEEGFAKAAAAKEEWLNTAYTFSYGEHSWTFTRAMVNADMDYDTRLEQAWNLGHIGSVFERKRNIEMVAETPIHITVEATYDETLIESFINQICAAIDVDPVDAVVVPDVNQPVVLTQSQTGLKVNRDQLRDQIIALITSDQVDTALPVETVFPAINSDDVSFQVIGKFSTDVSFRNRKSRTNVRIALNAFNGITVQPGETISFNEIVGERTAANGFQEATEFAGDVTTLGIGGGVCQASTTLYNALVMSGMSITDRHQHSMTVSYVDPSLDAMVSWPKKDLKFKNDTQYPVYIYTSVTDDDATVTIYGHRPEYFYRLESIVTEENIASTKINYIPDTEGKYVTYTDETRLESKGKSGCKSEGWIVAYDWETKQEVSRTQISRDNYSPGASVYYVGTVDRTAELMAPSTSPELAPEQ